MAKISILSTAARYIMGITNVIKILEKNLE
jgi:hypothetical protein